MKLLSLSFILLVAAHGGIDHGDEDVPATTGSVNAANTSVNVDAGSSSSNSSPVTPQQAIGLSFFGMAATIIGTSIPWLVLKTRTTFSQRKLKSEGSESSVESGLTAAAVPIVAAIPDSLLAMAFAFAGGALLFGSLTDVLPEGTLI
jgi:hypothetical protein